MLGWKQFAAIVYQRGLNTIKQESNAFQTTQIPNGFYKCPFVEFVSVVHFQRARGIMLIPGEINIDLSFSLFESILPHILFMAAFYDTHAHLDYPDFVPDLEQVVERAHAAGISKIISIGTDLESSRRAIQLSERFPQVFAVIGWHPSNAIEAPEDLRPALRELARHPKVVALGETGLDYHRLPSLSLKSKVQNLKSSSPEAPLPSEESLALEDEKYKAKQGELFRQHLEVAKEVGLNCVIHQRDSLEDTISQLQPYANSVRGVFHCFASDAMAMRRVLALGS